MRNRLAQKCRERSIELVEVFGKDISKECSGCGSLCAKGKGICLRTLRHGAAGAGKCGQECPQQGLGSKTEAIKITGSLWKNP